MDMDSPLDGSDAVTTNEVTASVDRLVGKPENYILHELCDATEDAIQDGGGFGWVQVPERDRLMRYWTGMFLIPERKVVVSRVDGVISGATQLHLSPPNNEAQAAIGTLTHHFVAPWARGKGLGSRQVLAVEAWAAELGLKALKLDIRASQGPAVKMLESLGYERWGTLDRYAFVDDQWVQGHYYFKDIKDIKDIKDKSA